MSFRLFSAVLPVLVSLLFSPVAVAKPPELTLANVYQKGTPLDEYWVSENLRVQSQLRVGLKVIFEGREGPVLEIGTKIN